MKKIIFLIIFLFYPVCSQAINKGDQEQYNKSHNEYITYKAKLDKLNEKILGMYKPINQEDKEEKEFFLEKIKLLKKSNDTWSESIKYDCKFENFDAQMGAAYDAFYEDCLTRRIKERIDFLKDNT